MKINNKLKTILLVSVGIIPFIIIPFTVGFFDEEKYNLIISITIAVLCFIIWGSLFRFVLILYIKPQYENGARKLVNGKYYGKLNNKNLPDGKGKLVWTDGSYYIGEFKDGIICGRGKKYRKVENIVLEHEKMVTLIENENTFGRTDLIIFESLKIEKFMEKVKE